MPTPRLLLGNRALSARLAALLAIIFGLVSLAGWAFGIQPLTNVIPGAVEMKANTALCIVLCGTALLISADRASGKLRGPALALCGIAAAIGAATLAEYFFGWNPHLDEILFKDQTGAYNVFRGRMSPFSAATFVAFGLAIAGLWRKSTLPAAKLAAAIGMVVGAVSLVGYAWGAGEIITDRWLPPVAMNTALCFVLLGGGILSTPNRARVERGDFGAELATIEVKILAGFILAITLLIGGGAYTYRTSVQFANSVEWIAHTQEVRTNLANLFGAIAGADVAQRDFLLTRESARLDEYRQMTDMVRAHLERLRQLIADNPEQVANLTVLKGIVDHRLDALAGGLAAFDAYGLPAARAVLGVARRSTNLQTVRAATDRMDAVEATLLNARQAEAARGRFTTLISLLLTLAAACGLFVALFRGIHREMLARRGAEQALRESDQYNRSIIESSPDCVAVLTTGGYITQMTPRGMQLLDVDDFSCIAGADWTSFWRKADQATARVAVAAARNGGEGRFNGFCATRTGIPKWWDVIVMPIRGTDGRSERLLAVARDVTEVKHTETNLVAANRFLDSLIENLPLMVHVKDARTLRYVRVNHRTEELLGMKRDAVLGRTAIELFPDQDPESLLAGDVQALAAGKLIIIPELAFSPNRLDTKLLQVMKMPIFDADGQPEFLLGIAVDITERRLAEQAIEALNGELLAKATQLEITNKELESFSYSISHDLRAPLRAIDGFAEMIEEDYRDALDPEGHRYLKVIRDNSKRMGLLIDDLLQFSRLGRQAVNHVQINMDALVGEVIEEALDVEAARKTGRRISGGNLLVDPLPPACGDRALLRQVWANLISNAIKYSSNVACPSIRISGFRTDREIQFSVQDNGVGFNMEYVEKLFGVFQRLHRADEFSGTGVGLAIVHRVITRHGGRVWAEGKINDGARFSFALPAGAHDG